MKQLMTFASVFVSSIGPAFAGPALYWSYLPADSDISQCLKKAEGVMTAKEFPIKKQTERERTGWTDTTTATIQCIKCGNQALAVIIVTSNKRETATYLLDAFKGGMSTAVFEETEELPEEGGPESPPEGAEPGAVEPEGPVPRLHEEGAGQRTDLEPP